MPQGSKRNTLGTWASRYSFAIIAVCILALVIAVIGVAYSVHDRYTASNTGASEINFDRELALTIGGEAVTAGEFAYALEEVKSSVVSRCVSGSASIGADFWIANDAECAHNSKSDSTSSTNRDQAVLAQAFSSGSAQMCEQAHHPIDIAVCEAVRLLERQHAAYLLAVEAGDMHEATWNEVLSQLHDTNSSNAARDQLEQTYYGMSEYEIPEYLSKYVSHLHDSYVNNDDAPQMDVSDADIQAHFEQNTWDFSNLGDLDGLTPVNSEMVKAMVKADLRDRIYFDLLATRIQNLGTTGDTRILLDFSEEIFGQ